MFTIRVVSIIALLILPIATCLHAQSSETITQSVSDNTVAEASSRKAVDTSALRLFFQQGDEERVAKEIARLQRVHPDWQPPEDLRDLAEPFDQFSKKFWLLFSAEKYQESSALLAEHRALHDQTGNVDAMVDSLERVKQRQRLLNAFSVAQYKKVIQIADSDPSMVRCDDPEVLWGLAASLAEDNHIEKAQQAYQYMLLECQDYMDAKTAFWKATEHLDFEQLVALQSSLSGERAKGLQGIIVEIHRQHIIAWTEKWVPGMGKPDEALEAHAASLADSYAEAPTAEDALLLGWFYRTSAEREVMHKWFEQAYQLSPTFETAEAVSLSFMENAHYEEAESFMYDWLSFGATERAVEIYLSIAANFISHLDVELSGYLSAENIEKVERISDVAISEKDTTLAQGLGWLAFKLDDISLAEKWFRSSLMWDPEMEPAAYGLALIYLHFNNAAELQAIQSQWPDSHRIQLVGTGLHVLALLPTLRNADQWFDKYIVLRPKHYEAGQYVDAFFGVDKGLDSRQSTDAARSRYARNIPLQLVAQNSEPVGKPSADVKVDVKPVQIQQPVAVATKQNASPSTARSTNHVGNKQSVSAKPSVAATSGAAGQSSQGCRRSVDIRTMNTAKALQHGWCLMEINRDMQALMAFERALQSSSASVRQEAAHGHALVLMRKGLVQQAMSSVQKASLTPSQREEIEIAALTEQVMQAWSNGQYQQVIHLLQRRSRMSPTRSDLLILEAWSYAKTGREGMARKIFRQLAQTGNTAAKRALQDLDA